MWINKKIRRVFANISALLKYYGINKALNERYDAYFFFNSWEFGGAERVHLQILSLFKDKKVICFITDVPNNDGFKNEFKKSCKVFKLGRWSEKKSFTRHMTLKISEAINKQKDSVVVGCNSAFLYRMIDHFEPHVTLIDILHNFSDGHEGAEWFSIPYVERINKRVILGETLKAKLKEHYLLNNINESLMERVTVIPNSIQLNKVYCAKDDDSSLNLIFVARNSKEKRPEIFLEIAEKLKSITNIKCTMVGNFEVYKDIAPYNTTILGSISNQDLLKKEYEKAHILVLTSYREGMPLVVFEAMNNGVVPVCTNVGELSNYIDGEKNNGFLIDNVEDITAIVDSFVQKIVFLNENREILKHFSCNAYETVSTELNEERFADAYRELILN